MLYNLQVSIATETDAAFSLAPTQELAFSPSLEVNLALARTAVQVRAVGMATEQDFADSPSHSVLVTVSEETNTAFAQALLVLRATGLGAETDTAFGLAGGLDWLEGNQPEVDLRNLLRDHVQPVHDASRYN
jgi:hypothetical protein